jgi:hypothetical protein
MAAPAALALTASAHRARRALNAVVTKVSRWERGTHRARPAGRDPVLTVRRGSYRAEPDGSTHPRRRAAAERSHRHVA